MRVATYNIRYDTPSDGEWGWNARKDGVITQLKHINADVFGLDEVLEHQRKSLVEAFNDYQSVGIGREDGEHLGEFNLIFYKKDKYELIESGHEWISLTPNEPSFYPEAGSPRIIVWAILEDKITKQKFVAVVTHLDDRSIEARDYGAKRIIELLSHDKFKNLPQFVFGDFNFANEEEKGYKILSQNMKDSTKDANGKAITPHTYQDFSEFMTNNHDKFTQLDYIFINSNVKTLGITHGEEITEAGKYPSDHFPVWGQYEIG